MSYPRCARPGRAPARRAREGGSGDSLLTQDIAWEPGARRRAVTRTLSSVPLQAACAATAWGWLERIQDSAVSQRLLGLAFSTLPGVLVEVVGRVAALWLARESGHGPSASRELGGQCRARRAGGGAEAGAQPGAAPGGGTDRDREGPGGPGAQRAAGEEGARTAAAAACSACPRPGNRSHQLTPPGARGGSGFRPGESLRPRRFRMMTDAGLRDSPHSPCHWER
ncbi:uncharacterized protein LOC119088961 [Peromyscus leucopus]|uniref:uncharacterized protein LOC119088961 n=1 Tax=Peromyscus leucopus TaxID=10041 RepID=UPI00188534EE|nr:uncharacterized protein LOC119088961 [Peromyscus leucopus]